MRSLAPSALNGKADQRSDRYKWIALVNTTMGMLMVTIDGSIVLIAMPDIFRGIKLDPLLPGNSFYLLWMILGFLVVTSVLVVSLGRLGDMYGRVKIYNLGFAVFTFFSLLLTITWMTGTHGAIWLIVMRVFQGVGGAMVFANSSAILTDAFPANQRGMALGINGVAATSGTFIGLVLGGLLAPINWRLIFLVSVPIGLFCTVWAYTMLHDLTPPRRTSIDWAGNITFALGLISRDGGDHLRDRALPPPHDGVDEPGGHRRAERRGRAADRLLHHRDAHAPSRCSACSCSASGPSPPGPWPASSPRSAGAGSCSCSSSGCRASGCPCTATTSPAPRCGPASTCCPSPLGFLIAGPISGMLSDRYGARPFATGGMLCYGRCLLPARAAPGRLRLLDVRPAAARSWV